MTIDIKKIAKSAAIAMKPEEEVDLQLIINLLHQLKNVDTTDIEPMISVFQGSIILREDIAIDPDSQEKVMKSANNSRYGYFVTPKFISN